MVGRQHLVGASSKREVRPPAGTASPPQAEDLASPYFLNDQSCGKIDSLLLKVTPVSFLDTAMILKSSSGIHSMGRFLSM